MPRQSRVKFIVVAAFAGAGLLTAQGSTVRGVVTDQSGAVIPKATVTFSSPDGLRKTVMTADDGTYVFAGLPKGTYAVEAEAPQLRLPQARRVSLQSGMQTLNLQLQVAAKSEQVTVAENAGPAVSTDPSKMPGPWCFGGTICKRSPTTLMILRPTCRRWPDHRRVLMAARSSSMASATASFRRKSRSANSDQRQPLLARVRHARLRPHRDLHQARQR